MWPFKRKSVVDVATESAAEIIEHNRLTDEMLETDAEASRLLKSDPSYMKNVKPGPPVDEKDITD